MAILDIFKRNKPDKNVEFRDSASKKLGAALQYSSSGYINSKALTLSAVYRCIEVISNSMAQLPMYPCFRDSNGFLTRSVKHPLYKILNQRPNPRMNRYTFIKQLVTSVLMNGNGYAYIEREKGKVIGLHYLPTEWVTVNPPEYLNQPVSYTVTGINGRVPASDMIHILNFSYDGIIGVGTLRHAFNILSLSYSADNHALGFYASGCGVSAILSSDKPLKDEQVKELKKNWEQNFGQQGQPGGMVVIEGGMTFQPVSISAKDSQLLETRTFNISEVCRFFGVEPSKCYDMSNNSYSSLEANQLSFLTDTLAPIVAKFQQEFTYKLFPDEEVEVIMDTDAILKLDKTSLSNYYSKLYQIGAVTIDEVRRAIDLPSIGEGGDVNFTQVNVMPVINALQNRPTSDAITDSEEDKKNDDKEEKE